MRTRLCSIPCCITLYILMCSLPLQAAEGWLPAGLDGGSVQQIAQSVSYDHVVYVTSRGAVFRTDSAGRIWRRVGHLPDLSILLLAVDGENPNRLYVFSRSNQAWSSDDAGQTWRNILSLPPGSATSVAVHPIQGGRLVVAQKGRGIRLTHDGGETWFVRPFDPDADIKDVHFLQSSGELLGLGGQFGEILYRSQNDGRSWERLGTPAYLGIVRIADLIIEDPAQPAALYLANFDGIYHSADGGHSWQLRYGAGLPISFTSLVVEPWPPYRLLARVSGNSAGTEEVWLSSDEGRSWQTTLEIERDLERPPLVVSGDVVLAGTGQGLMLSRDMGQEWSRGNRGLHTFSVSRLTTSQTGTLFALMNGRLWKGDISSRVWQRAGVHPHEVARPAQAFVIDPGSEDNLFLAIRESLYISVDGGSSWERRVLANEVRDVALDPGDPRTVYAAGYRFDGPNLGSPDTPAPSLFSWIGRSEDGGETWETLGEGSKDQAFRIVRVAPWDSSLIFAGRSGLERSEDGGESWQVVLDTESAERVPVMDLVFHPTEDGVMLVAAGSRRILKSMDSGQSFFESNSGLPDSRVTAVSTSTAEEDTFYAATLEGLFRSNDGGTTWQSVGGLDELEPSVLSLSVAVSTDCVRIFAGTSDDGMYYRTLEGCVEGRAPRQ